MTGAAMGYGFLEFDSYDNAKRVLDLFNGREIPGYHGKVYRLNWGERKVNKQATNNNNNNNNVLSTIT